MEGTIKPFVRKSLEINNKILEVFNDKLGLPKGALARLHAELEHSCSEARCIKNPPASEMSPDRAALGAHTDFGSLVSSLDVWWSAPQLTCLQSFLHNKLGGLQVYPPGAGGWYYIKV